MANNASAKALDFSNVKERGPVNPIHQPEGDYRGRVKAVNDIQMGTDKRDAWMFIIDVGKGSYPLRCGFNENELWKIRNLFVAAGIAVPKKRVKVDPTRVIGKEIGVTLEDHEYDGKMSSQVSATFPATELDEGTDGEPVDDEDEDADEETAEPEGGEEDEDEEEVPAPSAKAKPAPIEEDDDELESLDIEDL
jgi:hypothetical protein